MRNYLIKNASIVNDGHIFKGNVLIEGEIIKSIFSSGDINKNESNFPIIDATGKYLIPGIIDDQVHFREPGLTHKADIYTETKAAVSGGVTSFMEMPNTIPNALTQELLEEKYELAANKSLANYSFFMGASNDNLEEILKTNPLNVCGIKIFMGSSTGNMLVDNQIALEKIFSSFSFLIAVHCEDETTIRNNMIFFKSKYGENIPVKYHPEIRNEKACYLSSRMAVELAKKYNTRLHILHLSTIDELSLFTNTQPLNEKKITCEVCVHHLWFDDRDYENLGTQIKCNPAIKNAKHKKRLMEALLEDRIDIIATDHAPHTWQEKQSPYLTSPSGIPLIQHSLNIMMEFYHQKKITLEKIVEKMCHAPADCYKVDKRGYIKENYYADLVLVDLESCWEVNKSNLFYKCGWSPFEGKIFRSKITHTFINGHLVYNNGIFDESQKGKRLLFNRS